MACGCGLIGSPIISSGGSSPVYSKPAPRGGASALFSIEVLDISATYGIDVAVEHKNEEDTTWSSAGTFAGISATGVATKDISSLKEELRFAFTPTGTDGDAFHVIVAAPAWRPY